MFNPNYGVKYKRCLMLRPNTQHTLCWGKIVFTFNEENRSRSRHNVEGFFCRCTILRLAKPAFFRYNGNFTLVSDFYVARNVKFSLYLKKAGLASRNIVHLQKNPSTLCQLLLLFSSFYTWSRLDHYWSWSNVHQRDHRFSCLLKCFTFNIHSVCITSSCQWITKKKYAESYWDM